MIKTCSLLPFAAKLTSCVWRCTARISGHSLSGMETRKATKRHLSSKVVYIELHYKYIYMHVYIYMCVFVDVCGVMVVNLGPWTQYTLLRVEELLQLSSYFIHWLPDWFCFDFGLVTLKACHAKTNKGHESRTKFIKILSTDYGYPSTLFLLTAPLSVGLS